MRIGLIADIHGNHVALQQVLDSLARESVDLMLCAGDVAGLGPAPSACIRTLRDAGIATVRGNVDRWMVEGIDPDTSTPVAELTTWVNAHLSSAEHEWLRSLPTTRQIDTPAGPLTLVHSTPNDDLVTVAAVTPDDVIERWFAQIPDGIVVGGHTHVQLHRQTTRHLLLNPGSVGLPGTGPGTPDLPQHTRVRWAEYAVLDVSSDQRTVSFRRIPLDLNEVLAGAHAADMPHIDWWRSRWDTP